MFLCIPNLISVMVSKAIFGAGCFWCVEAAFQDIEGVLSVNSGYSGGSKEDPTYKEVCSGNTGHAEVVRLKYNNNLVSYKELLKVFFAIHNPETKNKEGADIGSQYRSIVLYTSDRQKSTVNNLINELESKNVYKNIVTEIEKFDNFYEAKKKHQNFFQKNPEHPYCKANIPDKLDKLEEKFPNLVTV